MSQDINENIDENKTLNEENEKTCEQNDQDNDNGLESELAKVKEDLIRATADFENIKKRLEREKADALKFANEGFARDLLPVIDALEIAANINGSDDIAAMKDGINLTIEQFKKCFEKYGIKAEETVLVDDRIYNQYATINAGAHPVRMRCEFTTDLPENLAWIPEVKNIVEFKEWLYKNTSFE